MYRTISTLALVFITFSFYAQVTFGIKGGVNYNFSKEANVRSSGFNYERNSENAFGYQLGVMSEFEIPNTKLILRPEVLYSVVKADYDIFGNQSDILTIQKMDIPLLLGIKIEGPFRLLVGPSFHFKLDSKFELEGPAADFREVEGDSFSLNSHIGIGVKFNKFDVDIRWERGITGNESVFVYERSFSFTRVAFDTRPNQLILSATYRFGI